MRTRMVGTERIPMLSFTFVWNLNVIYGYTDCSQLEPKSRGCEQQSEKQTHIASLRDRETFKTFAKIRFSCCWPFLSLLQYQLLAAE